MKNDSRLTSLLTTEINTYGYKIRNYKNLFYYDVILECEVKCFLKASCWMWKSINVSFIINSK